MTQTWEDFCAARTYTPNAFVVRRHGARRSIWLSLALFCASLAIPAQAVTLEQAVRAATTGYPSIEVARANTEAARFQIDQARAQHFPSVELNSQRRVAGAGPNSTQLNPTQPRLKLNLYASGAIEAGVEKETWREQSLASTEVVTREDVAFGAAQAWFRLLRAVRQVDSIKRNLDRHQLLVDDFTAIVAIDQGRRFDLVQARSRTETVRQTLAGGETEVAAARDALARFYPAPIKLDSLQLPADLPPVAALATDDLVTQHPSVEAARRSLLSAEANVRLDLESTAGAYSSSFLLFSWPAFDLSRNAAEGAAGATLIGARASIEEQERLVRERQQSAASESISAQRREAVAAEQVKLATELVEVYRAQFQIGRRNLLDLLTAFNELFSADAALEAGRVDKSLARYRMEYAAGRFAPLFDARRP
jgi:outer membrane protein, adhesin transport system